MINVNRKNQTKSLQIMCSLWNSKSKQLFHGYIKSLIVGYSRLSVPFSSWKAYGELVSKVRTSWSRGGWGVEKFVKEKFAEPQKGIKKICTRNIVKNKLQHISVCRCDHTIYTVWIGLKYIQNVKNRIFDHNCSSSHQWKAHLVIDTFIKLYELLLKNRKWIWNQMMVVFTP